MVEQDIVLLHWSDQPRHLSKNLQRGLTRDLLLHKEQ